MSEQTGLEDLETDLEGKKVDVVREKTTILMSAKLKEKIRTIYPDRSLGSVLEESAMIKLRRDGHIPEKPKGAEPADWDSYAKTKEKIALDEIKERAEKQASKKPKK